MTGNNTRANHRKLWQPLRLPAIASLLALPLRLPVWFAKAVFRPRAVVPGMPDTATPKNILIVQLYDTVGDVVISSPLIRELAKSFPGSKLTVAVSAHGLSGLLDQNPYISELIAIDARCRKWLRPLLLPWRHYRSARKLLVHRRFDIAIIPRYSVDLNYGTLLAYFSGAPCRIGYTEATDARKAVLNGGFDRLLTVVLPGSGVVNEVVSNLNVLSIFSMSPQDTRTEVWIAKEDSDFATAAIGHLRGRRVCISPTSGHSELKQWGVDRFGDLAVELVRRDCGIVLIGAPQDRSLADSIEQRFNGSCVNLVGQTTIRQMAAVISKCDVYAGNDAGPAHVAGAMGIPTVTIFGSTCPHRFAPWGPRNQVLTVQMDCGPCGTGHYIDRCSRCIYDEPKCLRAISAADVLTAILAAFAPA
jgi:ADP-heptose:LPS heptosyltransferase